MTASTKQRRNRLFAKHPYCFWCSRKVIHPNRFTDEQGNIRRGQKGLHKMATLDHLDDRLSGRRGMFMDGKHERTVLSCFACNTKRGLESQKRAAMSAPKAQLGQSQDWVTDDESNVGASRSKRDGDTSNPLLRE